MGPSHVTALTFENCGLAGAIDLWRPLPGLGRGKGCSDFLREPPTLIPNRSIQSVFPCLFVSLLALQSFVGTRMGCEPGGAGERG